jgi:hypothetical protein
MVRNDNQYHRKTNIIGIYPSVNSKDGVGYYCAMA